MENEVTPVEQHDDGTALSEPQAGQQPADTPGRDENGDGLPGGQTTADVPGDILGI